MADQLPAQDANQPEQDDRKDFRPLTLDTLPRKIISMILATMTVDPSEPYVLERSTLRPSATREEQDASARRDLASLCLVSKRMASEVRPALYQNLLIRDSDTLVHLYRTFLEKPHFGIFVKRMTLDVCHGREDRGGNFVYGLIPNVYLSPILSYPQHGFPSHLTVDQKCYSYVRFYEIAVEKLY